MKNQKKRRGLTPMGFVFEDELLELGKKLTILDSKFIDVQKVGVKKMKRYRVTIPTEEKPLFISIMREGAFDIRKR